MKFWTLVARGRASTGGSLFALLMASSLAFAGDDLDPAGERLFSNCKTCHEVGEGARHKIGPHLDGIIGRKAGSLDGFKYSNAMRAAGEGGLVWSSETLHAYLQKPRDFIKGNRMSYRGMADEGDRETLIKWLEAVSASEPGAPIDSVAATDHPARGFADIVLAMEGDPDYGEYLAGECVTCHQASGHADGIPSIVGLPRDYFITALFEYKTNVRRNEVMKLRVANLANEEIAALAAYFAGLEPQ
ncbi:c-type cytochrome [Oricola sp.]|uniref:c-type cytochrome n=1 Tax=Oricola sp. TaxID=1979950 RepID=UPI0025D003AA|nr:c-type cytochrome [Oricola sp.]MCI5076534.1 c-type cytochrome [Oricola sp.]